MTDLLLRNFYPESDPLRDLLVKHSSQVRDKALQILALPANSRVFADRETVITGAMLHDIGIRFCHAPSILCNGDQPYITHGVIGANLLRQYGREHSVDLERFARICERHTGAGLIREDIRRQNLPLPVQDFLPETPEEKLICLADKFFSKSGDMQEKSLCKIRHSMEKFGMESLQRFDDLCRFWNIPI